MREKILALMQEITLMFGGTLVTDLDDDTILLETGMDSMGFAVLVARLEEETGVDPFSLMEEPVYPRTLKDFVDIYEQYVKHDE